MNISLENLRSRSQSLKINTIVGESFDDLSEETLHGMKANNSKSVQGTMPLLITLVRRC